MFQIVIYWKNLLKSLGISELSLKLIISIIIVTYNKIHCIGYAWQQAFTAPSKFMFTQESMKIFIRFNTECIPRFHHFLATCFTKEVFRMVLFFYIYCMSIICQIINYNQMLKESRNVCITLLYCNLFLFRIFLSFS